MINRAVLTGRLTKDIELRYTQSGVAVGSFTLAVDRNFKNANNEREVDWINFVIWRKAAEAFANFTHKGSLVGIDGRIQTRNYEKQQGQRVYVTEVVAETFQVMESRKDQQGGQSQGGYSNPSQATPNFARDNSEPFGNSSPMDISEDDLPF